MTSESLQGLSNLEPLPAEADTDTLQQVSEADSDTTATEPPVAVQEAPAASPEPPIRAHRRRLGSEEVPPEPNESSAKSVVREPAPAPSVMADLRGQQSLVLGLVGGVIAMVVGAILWATVTIATSLQIGWMAIGLGAMVGSTIRMLGKGITRPFGYIGATLSLLGCLAGNLLSICVLVAQQHGLPLTYVLTHLNPGAIPEAMAVSFHPLDLLFYGLAVYTGYRVAFRRVTAGDLTPVASNHAPGSTQTPLS